MFDEALLDSSPSRVSVLRAGHYALSAGLGVLGFLAWYFAAPIVLGGPFESVSAGVAQSIIYGLVPLLLTSLILCYVYSDTRHLGFNTWGWFVVCLLFHSSRSDCSLPSVSLAVHSFGITV